MLFCLLLVLASACIHVRSSYYELYSEFRPDERWFLDDAKLVPISCDNGDCSALFNKHNKHKIAKRSLVQVETMEDYIKFLLRGNRTKDDDTNTEPYRTGNISLGNNFQITHFALGGLRLKRKCIQRSELQFECAQAYSFFTGKY